VNLEVITLWNNENSIKSDFYFYISIAIVPLPFALFE